MAFTSSSIFFRSGLSLADCGLTEEDIRDYCRGRISRFKYPKHIAFVDSYPMTASGKVQKYKLRDLSVKLFPGPDRMPPG